MANAETITIAVGPRSDVGSATKATRVVAQPIRKVELPAVQMTCHRGDEMKDSRELTALDKE
jgi:hypothetical protein